MRIRKFMAIGMAAGMLMTAASAIGEATVQTGAAQTEAPQAEAAQSETAQSTDQAALLDSRKLDASYTLALNAINAEDYESAKSYLNVCFAYCDPQANPEMYADLLLKRACIDVIEEKADMAVLELDAALRVKPDLADAYLVLTQVYTSQGRMDAAIQNLEKYIELTGDTSLYETVAQLNEAKGDVEAAQAAYEKYVEGVGGEVPEAGFQSGLYMMQAGKLDEAITAFEAYVNDETYAAGAQYNIGVCRMNQGDYAKAIEAFNASEAKGGKYEGLLYNRGVCNLLSEQWEAAEADFTKSMQSEPYVEDARYNLGLCQLQLEKYDAAVKTFTESIENAKKTEVGSEGETAAAAQPNVAAYYYRAVSYAALGKLEEALADYTFCIEQGYELAQSYYQRSLVYEAMGDSEKQNSDLQSMLSVAE